MNEYIRSLLVFALLSVWINVSFAVSGGGFLSSEDAQTADTDALLAEVAVFRSIRDGITLSLAQCDFSGSCEPAVTSDEVQQIISALDQRINGLSQRQQASDDGAGLEDVLIAYVDELDGFSGVLEKLGSISAEEAVIGGDIDESELFGSEEEKTDTTENVDQFDIFADEDEEL